MGLLMNAATSDSEAIKKKASRKNTARPISDTCASTYSLRSRQLPSGHTSTKGAFEQEESCKEMWLVTHLMGQNRPKGERCFATWSRAKPSPTAATGA